MESPTIAWPRNMPMSAGTRQERWSAHTQGSRRRSEVEVAKEESLEETRETTLNAFRTDLCDEPLIESRSQEFTNMDVVNSFMNGKL